MSVTVCSRASRQRLMPQQLQGFALGTLLALPLTVPAVGIPPEAEPMAGRSADAFAAFPVIGHDKMAELRGGFNVGGLELEFGANVRTLIDDVVRLETIVQFTKAGIVSADVNPAEMAANARAARGSLSRVAQDTAGLVKDFAKRAASGSREAPANESNSEAVANAGNARATANSRGAISASPGADLAELRNLANRIRQSATSAENALAEEPQTRPTAQSSAAAASRQVDLSGLQERIQGVVLNDAKGLTTAIQQLSRSRVSNTVINQANNRRIEVQMELQVDVKNFNSISESLRNTLLNQRLARPNF